MHSCSPLKLGCGHFTKLFYGGWQGILPVKEAHAEPVFCFSSLTFLLPSSLSLLEVPVFKTVHFCHTLFLITVYFVYFQDFSHNQLKEVRVFLDALTFCYRPACIRIIVLLFAINNFIALSFAWNIQELPLLVASFYTVDGDCSRGWQILVTQPWAPAQWSREAPVTLIKTVEMGGRGKIAFFEVQNANNKCSPFPLKNTLQSKSTCTADRKCHTGALCH